MKNTIRIIAALVMIIGTGLVHGAWTNRWRTAPALAALAGRLDSLPKEIGEWTSVSRELPAREQTMAGAVGYISRVYTNPGKGLSISVLLLSGLPGDISTHTPDACYPGAGLRPRHHGPLFLQVWNAPRTGRPSSGPRWPAGEGPIRPPCDSSGRGTVPRDGPHPKTHAGPWAVSRCSPSFMSSGKPLERSSIRKKTQATNSWLSCSRSSTASWPSLGSRLRKPLPNQRTEPTGLGRRSRAILPPDSNSDPIKRVFSVDVTEAGQGFVSTPRSRTSSRRERIGPGG